MRFEILPGLPPYGPMAISFTKNGAREHREGLVVRFYPAASELEASKAYYLLPKGWGEDAGYSYTMVGSVVVPQKTATAHSTFAVQAAAASAARPPEFDKLSYAKAP